MKVARPYSRGGIFASHERLLSPIRQFMNTNKKCNFCKEEILKDATVCKHCGKKQPSIIVKRILKGFLILFVIGIIRSSFSDGSSTTQQPVVESVKVGENAHLTISGDNPVLVAINKEYYDEMFRLITVRDTLGIAQMSLDGKVLLVDKGTSIKVIGTSMASSEVRINEGKYIGKSGWVPNEMVAK
jgi:hypothetical protein